MVPRSTRNFWLDVKKCFLTNSTHVLKSPKGDEGYLKLDCAKHEKIKHKKIRNTIYVLAISLCSIVRFRIRPYNTKSEHSNS